MSKTKILAIIPARGGSKGVPRKNIREAGGKPLMAWTIEEAKKSVNLDKVIVSSEDKEILSIAEQYHCDWLKRPHELAQDDTPSIDVIFHVLDHYTTFTHVVLLQPTSPFRTVLDIDRCIELCFKLHSPACVSVCESDKSPYWMYTLNPQLKMKRLLGEGRNITRRQDLPPAYVLNGAVYVAEVSWLRKNRTFVTEETSAYIMPQERSLDVDSPLDFKIADFLLKRHID